jgi:hypothetical protein
VGPRLSGDVRRGEHLVLTPSCRVTNIYETGQKSSYVSVHLDQAI